MQRPDDAHHRPPPVDHRPGRRDRGPRGRRGSRRGQHDDLVTESPVYAEIWRHGLVDRTFVDLDNDRVVDGGRLMARGRGSTQVPPEGHTPRLRRTTRRMAKLAGLTRALHLPRRPLDGHPPRRHRGHAGRPVPDEGRRSTAASRRRSQRSRPLGRAVPGRGRRRLASAVGPELPRRPGWGSACWPTCAPPVRATSRRSSWATSRSQRTGRLISRLTNDVDALEQLVTDGATSSLQNTLTLVGTGVVLLLLDWRLALATMVVFPLMAVAHRALPAVLVARLPADARAAGRRHLLAAGGHLRRPRRPGVPARAGQRPGRSPR